ncbi:ABC transporter ATP-binding protein [Candidatus Babeliales bacterium]|nr:ABC transporter ATP-binding protein [Candidatus Babeliales bacterium]
MTLFQKLRVLLTRRDKGILLLLLPTTFFISLLEIAFLSLTMLFITMITNFESIASNKYYLIANQYFSAGISPSQALIFFGYFIIIFYLIRCGLSFYYTYYLSKFSQTRYNAIAFRFFQNYFTFNFKQFTSKNSSSIYKLIFFDAQQMTVILTASLFLLSEVFTVALIYSSLVYINWKMTLVLTALLTVKVTLLLKTFSIRLKKEGAKVSFLQQEIGKIFRESFGNFKIIKLLSNEQGLLARFSHANFQLVRANTINTTLQNTPRLLLETMGFIVLVSAVIYVVYRVETPQYVIPILSMYALAFYRFMPSITRIMNYYNQIIFAKSSIDKSNPLFYQTEKLGNETVAFNGMLELKNVTFSYDEKNYVLRNVSLSIPKNKTIALVGESGAGKSTLADILMGLYIPKDGTVSVDGKRLTMDNIKNWRGKVGYIPQQIYLFDGTIAENIVFGRHYNEFKVIEVLKKANLYAFLNTQNGIHTKVGEDGIRLSGGQRQRVAIARALYSDPEILVLDEATSSLDTKTEAKIMDEIYESNKDKTIIIIAHRLSTIQKCDLIYKIENRQVLEILPQTPPPDISIPQTTQKAS